MDLNLLKTFDAVMKARSVNIAAEALGISAPAVSQSLNRLREQYNDPLFIREGRGIAPTNFAVELHAEVQEPLSLLINGAKSRQHFNALKSHRTFRISSHKDIDLLVVPRLTQYRAQFAPNTTIEADIEHINEQVRQDDLRQRKVDIILSTVPLEEHSYHNLKLFEEDLVVVLSVNHPRIQSSMNIEQFFSEHHVLWQTQRMDNHALNSVAYAPLRERKVAYRTGSSLTGISLTSGTDWLCVSARSLVDKVTGSGKYQVFELPFKAEPMPVYMTWHRSQGNDKGHQWLREALINTTQNNS
ncbi:LysR family transcriptional regulator, transcriptional activator for leuABCD operon [Vibrio crassostreae]|nr:LysR family transcriptional regulator, transcriptional activator for leuABCD operon [Vibrio crassostreae]CAK1890283.1 LysR family transcriptional regulator, transcriptional activator for leuABCD operon [Vibrio crassostreae]CAK1921857.1 LysR family transcriptional regulator, transcriptional activator for leuABCD operon [Vibrio crassostreae]CAK2299066.1 LysR family transcriptional regulator, transcriptional activator for leuABCD operon [Vibrio crassostreae]CAK2640708.1 LysR family transcriptio